MRTPVDRLKTNSTHINERHPHARQQPTGHLFSRLSVNPMGPLQQIAHPKAIIIDVAVFAQIVNVSVMGCVNVRVNMITMGPMGFSPALEATPCP
jgi:hypothetical protein